MSPTPTTVAPRPGFLIRVADPFGRQLSLTWSIQERIATLTDPDGQIYVYGYNAQGNLNGVTYPDSTPANPSENPKRTYHYENTNPTMILDGSGEDAMDFFENLLSSNNQGSGIQPELLELLGKKAATQFLQDGKPLNETIASLAASEKGLETEHIRRIVEFANNEVFLSQHRDGADKVVDFPVADAGMIIRDLRDGGSPAHDGKTMQSGNKDYFSAPNKSQMEKKDFADPESAMQSLFQQNEREGRFGQGEQIPKEASARTFLGDSNHLRHANPINDIFDLTVNLEATREKLAGQYEMCDLLIKEARENLYLTVKHEVLDDMGAGLGGVAVVVEKVAGSVDLAHTLLGPIVERLVVDQVLPNAQLQQSMTKTAGRLSIFSIRSLRSSRV